MDESSVCTISVKLEQSAFAEVSVAFRVGKGDGEAPDIHLTSIFEVSN